MVKMIVRKMKTLAKNRKTDIVKLRNENVFLNNGGERKMEIAFPFALLIVNSFTPFLDKIGTGLDSYTDIPYQPPAFVKDLIAKLFIKGKEGKKDDSKDSEKDARIS